MIRTILSTSVCTLALGVAVSAAAVPVTGDPVHFWQDQMIGSIALPPDLAGHPYAMVDVAMFDAVNQAAGKPYHGYPAAVSSPPAAIPARRRRRRRTTCW